MCLSKPCWENCFVEHLCEHRHGEPFNRGIQSAVFLPIPFLNFPELIAGYDPSLLPCHKFPFPIFFFHYLFVYVESKQQRLKAVCVLRRGVGVGEEGCSCCMIENDRYQKNKNNKKHLAWLRSFSLYSSIFCLSLGISKITHMVINF